MLMQIEKGRWPKKQPTETLRELDDPDDEVRALPAIFLFEWINEI